MFFLRIIHQLYVEVYVYGGVNEKMACSGLVIYLNLKQEIKTLFQFITEWLTCFVL